MGRAGAVQRARTTGPSWSCPAPAHHRAKLELSDARRSTGPSWLELSDAPEQKLSDAARAGAVQRAHHRAELELSSDARHRAELEQCHARRHRAELDGATMPAVLAHHRPELELSDARATGPDLELSDARTTGPSRAPR